MKNLIKNNSFRDEERHKKMKTEDMKGEESFSGSMPDPDTDDDVTQMEHEMGLYEKENEENPQEAALGEEVNKAELERFEED
jgi:hypothetical protein